MNIEGRVTIDVTRGAAPDVRVSFTQPGDVSRVLVGKTPRAAMAIIPALFALCGKAQAHAARLALDAAEGRVRAADALATLQCLTEMESLRENTLRIAFDWPRLLGERADPAGLKALMRLVPELDAVSGLDDDAGHSRPIAGRDCARAHAIITQAEELLSLHVFGEPVERWRQRTAALAVGAWAAEGRTPSGRLLHRIASRGQEHAGAIAVRTLPPLDDSAMHSWLRGVEDDAAHLPMQRQGSTPETTLLSRHAGDPRLAMTTSDGAPVGGLWSRLTARLVELSELPDRMRALVDGGMTPASGRALGEASGMGEVSAARGALVHAVALERGRIAHYRVLPPTRWNFDAGGVAKRAVESIVAMHGDDAEYLADLMVNAIDPCVAYSVRMH